MLEKEFKSLIDKDIYERVKEAYEWDSVCEQTNTYYTDVNGILKSHSIVVRARDKNGSLTLQIKKHKAQKSVLQISEEEEFPLESVPEFISAEDAKKYIGLDTGDLIKLGSLTTLRHIYTGFENTEICLDKSVYLDIEDYEIEVEYTGSIPESALRGLKEHGVAFDKPAFGKYSRFLRAYP